MLFFQCLFCSLFFVFYSSISFAQLIDLQLEDEEAYPIIVPGLAGNSGLTPLADKLGRSFLYVSSNEAGLKIYDVSNGLLEIAVLDAVTLEGKAATLEQVDTLLYVGLGDLFGDTVGGSEITVINIADPFNPEVIGHWEDSSPTSGVASGVGVIRVKDDFAYLGAMAEGLIILNISSPSAITMVSKYTPAIGFPFSGNQQAKVNARGMSIKDNLVYLCYDAGGVRIIDCSNVNAPIQISEFANPITSVPFDLPRAYNNMVLDDTIAYVAVDYCGMEVWGVSDPTSPNLLAHWNPVGCPTGSWFQAPIHTNEIILQKSCDLLFMSTGKSDMMVVDIADPLMPVAIDSFGTVTDTTGTWGIDITDEYVYLTYVYLPDLPILPEPFHSLWGGIKQLSYTKCTAGISELSNEISVYPNPSKGMFNVQLNGTIGSNYSIYNILGEKVKSGSLSEEELQVNLNAFENGSYYLKIGTYRARLVLQK